MESFRESPFHNYLEKLAGRTNLIDQETLESYFADILKKLINTQLENRRMELLEKARQDSLHDDEKKELVSLFGDRIVD